MEVKTEFSWRRENKNSRIAPRGAAGRRGGTSVELYSTASQLCMAHTGSRLGCTKCSVRHRTIREQQKFPDLQIKKEHGDVMGNTWCQREKESQGRKKTLWSVHWEEYWHTRGWFLSWLCISKAKFGSPIQEDASLEHVFNSTSVLCTNRAEYKRATFYHQIDEAPIYTVTAWKSAPEKAAKVTGQHCACLLQTSPPPSSKISGRESKLPEPDLVLQVLVNCIPGKTSNSRGISFRGSSRAQVPVQSHLLRVQVWYVHRIPEVSTTGFFPSVLQSYCPGQQDSVWAYVYVYMLLLSTMLCEPKSFSLNSCRFIL